MDGNKPTEVEITENTIKEIKNMLMDRIKAQELMIDNLVNIILSMEEDRKSLVEELAKVYLIPNKEANG